MKRILILVVALGFFLCSTVSAGQGGGGESTKKKASPKKTSGTKPGNPTPARAPLPPARPKTPTLASLMVNSNLPNATVTINGRTAGNTDSNGHLVMGSMKPGAYTVSVTKPGFQPDKIVVTLARGQSETLNFELKPITQSLTISSTPAECEVYIDEILRGRTDASGNVRLADVPVGEHRVTIRKARYREAVFPVSLSLDKEGEIDATLELAIGFLTVTTNAPNSSIDISGLGHFDKLLSKVECQPGTYTVTVSSPFYVTSRKEISVSAGQEVELSVILEADRDALTNLAYSYLAKNEFAAFTDVARRAIDAGGSIEFRLKHHHALGIELHPIKLTLTATNIFFDPQVSQPFSCSFRQFTHPLEAVVTAKFEEADGSLFSKRQKGFYLKLTLEDPKNPKKTHELNFADLASSFVKSPNGKTVMSYRSEAARALTAISRVFQSAISKARSSPTTTAASPNRSKALGKPENETSMAAKKAPEVTVSLINLGRQRIAQKDFDGAIEVLTQAVKVQPTSSQANYFLGEAYFQIKKGSLAVGYWNEAIKLDPVGMADAHLRLATLYNAAGMKDRAAAEYEQFLKKKPDYPDREKLLDYIAANKKS